MKKTVNCDLEDNDKDYFGIPLTIPTNVRKQVKLNSCYFTTIPGGRLEDFKLRLTKFNLN